MPKMFNIALSEWRDIPENEVQGAYESGQYVFAKGELVPVSLADGRYGTIKGEEFKDVIRAGGSYDLPSERQYRADEEKYDSRNAEALLLAAGRGLTFGLSDVALEKMGAYTDEEIQGLEEHNSILSGVGEIGGALAPALLTGGGSALGAAGVKGLLKQGVHYSPAGFAMRSAAAAEAAIGKKLGVEALEGGSKMLRAVPGFGAAGAVEGALFGAGETFSEELLGRTDKTAEQIVGDIGFAALLGGGLSSAFSMAPAAVAKAFQSQAKTEYPKGIAKVVGEFKDKYTAAMTGMDEELLAKTRDPKFLDDLLEFEDVEKKVNVSAREYIGDLFGVVEGTTKGVTEAKNRLILPKVKPAVETDTINGSMNAVSAYIKSLGESLDTLGDKTQRTAARRLMKDAVKLQDGIAKSIEDRLHAAGYKNLTVKVKRGKKGSPDYGTIEVVSKQKPKKPGPMILDATGAPIRPKVQPKVKYNLGQVEGLLNKGAKPGTLEGTAQLIFKEVDRLKMGQSRLDSGMAGYGALRDLLENEKLFGEAATIQTKLNSAWKPLIEQQKEFASQFMKRHKGTKRLEADGRKIKSFLRNLRNEETSEHARSTVFNAYADAFDVYSKVAKEVGLDLTESVPSVLKGAQSLRNDWTDFKYLQAAKKELSELTRNPGLISETFATVGGFAFGGLPGALAARYIRNIATPGDAVRRRVTAHGIKSRTSQMINTWAEKSTKRLMGNIKGAPTVKPFDALTGSKRVSLLGLIGAKATGNEEEDTRKEIEAFATIASPEVMAQKIKDNMEPLRDAPQITEAAVDKGVTAAMMYGDVIRENTETATNIITGETRISVSDSGAAKIAKARNACFGRACEQVALEFSQGSVTPETLKITDALYPLNMTQYREDVRTVLAKVYENSSEPPSLQVLQSYASLNYTSVIPVQSGLANQAVYEALKGQQKPQGNRSAASLKGTANRARSVTDNALT